MERKVERVQFGRIKPKKLIRTAAYARVSTGKEAMLHSLSAQVSYYNSLIQSNPEWLFAGVYADEALTGTKDSRENFQRMLADCRAGCIDQIITKSISRFARNTVTLLETVRELKSLGVDVYFEEQNIHTMNGDGELMLTILASYAEEESFSASENQKWRIRKDFEQGKISSIHMIGYRRKKDGTLEIIPEEAEIVRKIFQWYLSGMGRQTIANRLNAEHIPTKNGLPWTQESLKRILTNEKYCGDVLLQKYYTVDHLTKRTPLNDGVLPQYYAQDAHPPIVDRETFEAVQRLIQQQTEHFTGKQQSATYPFTGLIRCGCCGNYYRRKTRCSGIFWICHTYNTKGKKFCPTAKQIPEETLYGVCCDVLGMTEFDEITFKSQIKQIIVPKPNHLTFVFQDGHEQRAMWSDRSRAESWTPEMRAKAREITRKRAKK